MALIPLDPRRPWTDIPVHVLDFEGSRRTGIVEFGVATLLGGEVVGLRTEACAPLAAVPAAETRCHGLADGDLDACPPFRSHWSEFNELRGSGIFAAHPAAVEASLLAATWPHPAAVPAVSEVASAQAEWGPWVDTLALARARRPDLPDHGLEALIPALGLEGELMNLAARLCPPGRRRPHCAGYDALAAALVLRCLAPPGARLADLLALGSASGDQGLQGELLI